MIPPLNSNTDLFLNSLAQISNRLEQAQRQIGTGKRVNTVADSPIDIPAILQSQQELASTQQIDMNLGRVKTEVDGAEGALQSAVKIMERVQTLGSEGVNTTQTPEARASLANEVGSLLEQLGGISQTAIEGRYIFSGDSDHTAPYAIDLTRADPIGTYAGSAATREVQHPNGSRFGVALTAQSIFDAGDPNNPSQNVFHAVNALRVALQSSDTAGISAALANVGSANTYLNSQLAFYGNVQNKVAGATDYGAKQEVRLQTQLSTLQDADMTTAIVQFQQAQTQQQAALMIQAKMPRSSLFDFLG